MITYEKSKNRKKRLTEYCYLDGGYFGELSRFGNTWSVFIGGGERFFVAGDICETHNFEVKADAIHYLEWWANYAWRLEIECRQKQDAEMESLINFHENAGRAFVPAPERPPISNAINSVLDNLNERHGEASGLMGLKF